MMYQFPAVKNPSIFLMLFFILSASLLVVRESLNYLNQVDVSTRALLAMVVLFFMLLAAGLALVAFWFYFRLRYVITDQHLVIELDFWRVTLPLAELEVKKKVLPLGKKKSARYWLLTRWPRPGNYLTIACHNRFFFISPRNQVAFLSTLYRLQQQPAAQQSYQQPVHFLHPFQLQLQLLADRSYRRVLLVNLSLFVAFTTFVFWRIEQLVEDEAIIRYTIADGILEQGSKDELLVYVVISAIFLVVLTLLSMLVYRRERIGAYMSLGFFPVLQLGLLIPVIAVTSITP